MPAELKTTYTHTPIPPVLHTIISSFNPSRTVLSSQQNRAFHTTLIGFSFTIGLLLLLVIIGLLFLYSL